MEKDNEPKKRGEARERERKEPRWRGDELLSYDTPLYETKDAHLLFRRGKAQMIPELESRYSN